MAKIPGADVLRLWCGEKDSLLYNLDNCILTPHIAGSTGNEVKRMGNFFNRLTCSVLSCRQ
ncbi:MAG: hypothetical protein IJX79_01680 [Clostridia bacterium]|nr:hypothetical protein [Clostridia bacterium]